MDAPQNDSPETRMQFDLARDMCVLEQRHRLALAWTRVEIPLVVLDAAFHQRLGFLLQSSGVTLARNAPTLRTGYAALQKSV